MAVFKKKKDDVKDVEKATVKVEISDFEVVKKALEASSKDIEALKKEVKEKEDKIAVLSSKLVSKDEEIAEKESIERNSETVFSKSGFSAKFIQNVAILNTDHIVSVSPKFTCGASGIQANITLINGKDLIMRIQSSDLLEEFNKQYEELLKMI